MVKSMHLFLREDVEGQDGRILGIANSSKGMQRLFDVLHAYTSDSTLHNGFADCRHCLNFYWVYFNEACCKVILSFAKI
jgi:hypothetical protein